MSLYVQEAQTILPDGSTGKCGYFEDTTNEMFLMFSNIVYSKYEPYVFTLQIKALQPSTLSLYEGGTADVNSIQLVSDEWNNVEIHIESDGTPINIKLTSGKYYIYHGQITKGNDTREWVPPLSDTPSILNETRTEYLQTAQEFSWLVADDYSESNVKLSKDAYEVAAENITLKGKHIQLDGDTTVGEGFTLRADNIEAGTLSADITATNFKLVDGKVQINASEDITSDESERNYIRLNYNDKSNNKNVTELSVNGFESEYIPSSESEMGYKTSIYSGNIVLENANKGLGFSVSSQQGRTIMREDCSILGRAIIMPGYWFNRNPVYKHALEIENGIEDADKGDARIEYALYVGSRHNATDIDMPGAFISNYGAMHLCRTDGSNPYMALYKNGEGASMSYNGTNVTFSRPIIAPNIGSFDEQNSQTIDIFSSTNTEFIMSLSLSAGLWIVQFWATWGGNANGRRHINISSTENSATANGRVADIRYPGGTGTFPQSKVAILNVPSQMVYYINVGQNSGSTLSCTAGYRAIRIK